MKKVQTVKVGNSECTVQTLMEWINERMKQVSQSFKLGEISYSERDNLTGRYVELSIIKEKLNDGRIQEIGKVKFKKVKS